MKSKSGFTIVELLVVIIAIALLAAISVIVYNGIRQKASNSQILVAVKNVEKLVMLYRTKTGELPIADANLWSGISVHAPTGARVCIGLRTNRYCNQSKYSSSAASINGVPYEAVQDNYITKFKKAGIQLPNANMHDVVPIVITLEYEYRGIQYGVDIAGPYLIYAQFGKSCPDGDFVVDQLGSKINTYYRPTNENTLCRHDMPKN